MAVCGSLWKGRSWQTKVQPGAAGHIQGKPGTVLRRPIMCYIFEKQALWGCHLPVILGATCTCDAVFSFKSIACAPSRIQIFHMKCVETDLFRLGLNIPSPHNEGDMMLMVLGKLGSGILGPGKLGPSPIWREIGPRTFWGPGKSDPGRLYFVLDIFYF